MAAKYDSIGTNYNLTRKADSFLTHKLVQHLNPLKDGLYLDIGCGTGNYTNELQKKGYQFIGIDPSEKMLEKAIRKNTQIDWRIGSAENTGLPKNHVDGIMGSLTLHHWADLKESFLELHRVLKPKGKIVIFTATPEQMEGYWLNWYFPKMLSNSIDQMPPLELLKTALKNAGIQFLGTENYSIRPDLQDHFLYCGKHNPELYFDEQIRQGISSFSSLANQTEVVQGLAQLRKDIDNGKITKVIKDYKNDLGDYIFILGENPLANQIK